jgi:hypothetical protein
MEWSREHGPAVDVWLMLANAGTIPATDVRLTLTFPSGSFIMPVDRDHEAWHKVIRPAKPEAEWMLPPSDNPFGSIFKFAPSHIAPVFLPPRFEGPPRPAGPILDDLQQVWHVVRYTHPKLIQGGQWRMAPIRVYLPPSTGQGFGISYTLRADEVPQVETATLPVRFTPETGAAEG